MRMPEGYGYGSGSGYGYCNGDGRYPYAAVLQ
jgi:hypothetical protein